MAVLLSICITNVHSFYAGTRRRQGGPTIYPWPFPPPMVTTAIPNAIGRRGRQPRDRAAANACQALVPCRTFRGGCCRGRRGDHGLRQYHYDSTAVRIPLRGP